MLKQDVIAYFGGVKKTADAMDITVGAVRQWGQAAGHEGKVSPAMAMRAYCKSNGELLLDPFDYEDWPVRGKWRKDKRHAA
jgi:hypothetical protein